MKLNALFPDILPEPHSNEIGHKSKGVLDLPGDYIVPSEKGSFLFRSTFTLPHQYGNISLTEVDLTERFLQIHQISPEQATHFLLLDTETTGLSRGAGTIPFMVGLAEFSKGEIQIEQYFLSDPAAEYHFAGILAQRISTAGILVTYNGKAYDLPILEARWALHKIDPPEYEQLDLLPASRLLWRRALKRCTLQNIEFNIVGLLRDPLQEIHGSAIPSSYYEFLRTGKTDDIKRILYHNQLDLLTLAAILNKLLHLTSFDCTAADRQAQQVDPCGLAKLSARIGDLDTAVQLVQNNIADADPAMKHRLAKWYTKSGQPGRAKNVWQQLAENKDKSACERLAIIAEHDEHNFADAIYWAKQALELVESEPWVDMTRMNKLVKRISRLKQKLENRTEGEAG